MKYASWVLSLAVAAAWMAPAAAQTQQRSQTQSREHMPAQAAQNAPRLVVNGRVVQTDVAPRIISGTTLVPIRFVAEALGADVTWQPQDREAVITYEGQRVVVQAGEDTLIAGNRTIRTRVPTQVIQGRTMIPLRAVAESLGANVRWDPQTRTVYVQTAAVDEQPGQVPPAVPPGMPEPTPADQLRQSIDVNLSTGQESYQAGTPVEMTLRIQNTGNEPVRLQMRTGQMYDFIVQRNGEEVWRWSQGRAFTQAIQQLALSPDETRTFTVTWDQRDNNGNPVEPGTYTIIGRVTHGADVQLQDTEEIRITGQQ